jgi:hypothetical protein
MSEEIAPGQFNFINSQLRMNENHVENQNEFVKISVMVKNLVECKIGQIFKDIDHAKEDLKMRIAFAIEAHENASTLAVKNGNDPNNANLQEQIDNLKKENDSLKKPSSNPSSNTSSNISSNPSLNTSSNASSNSDELNKAKTTIDELTRKLNANSGPSNIPPNTDLQTRLDEALAKIKELTGQLNVNQGNDGNNNGNNNGNNKSDDDGSNNDGSNNDGNNDGNNNNNNNDNNNSDDDNGNNNGNNNGSDDNNNGKGEINNGNNTLSPNDFYKMYAKK